MGIRLFNHPVLCNYYMTYRCNARCDFCDIWEKPSPYVSMENFRANLRDLKRLGVKVIDFTGGEPLLHRQLPQFLAEAKAAGFRTTVTSNGLLYPKHAEAMRGNVDMLHFSLDAPDAETHDAIRGVRCFDFVLRSIDLAVSIGERPDILFTATPETIDGIERVYREIALPNNLILILNPVFGYNEVGHQLLNADHRETLRRWGRKRNVYLNEGFLKLREAGGNDINDPVCVAASSTVVISPQNGLVLPCYHLGTWELPIEDRLYDLWHGQEVQSLIENEGRLPECQGCTVNCYMQPSFAYQLNGYFWRALPSTLKYTMEKWVLA